MQTKAKSNSVVTHSMQDGNIVFDVLGAGKLVFDPNKVSAENRARAMIHGFVQRIVDAGARMRDPKTGASASPEEKLASMKRVVEHYMSGTTEWNLRAAPAASKGPDAGLVIMAMIRALSGVPTVEAAERVFAQQVAKGKFASRDEAIAAWAKSRQVADAIKLILAERAAEAANLDAEDMLAELAMEDDEDAPM